jgi:RNA polymerase sigma factor (sigma-70 family)
VTDLRSRSDEALLAEADPAHAGAAFACFYERHERALLAFFVRRVRDPEVAADLTAETFAEALASRRRFRRMREGSAAGWLYGIAGNLLGRSVRRGRVEDRFRRRLGTEPLILEDEQLRGIEALEAEAAVLEALETLTPAQRDAVRAYVLDEHGYAHIAQRLQCSEAVVRQRVSRGLSALRQRMEESA